MGEESMSEQHLRVQETAEKENQAEVTREIDLAELAYRLLMSWKLILCCVLVCAIGFGVYSTFFVTPMYEATATVFVLGDSDAILNLSAIQTGNALTQDYIKILETREVFESVKKKLNLPYSYSEMRKMLSVTNKDGTRMLDITVQSSKPAEAADIANQYAELGSARIAQIMAINKPSEVSRALTPVNPVSPNKARNVVLGGILGGVLACAYVAIRMIADDKYKTVEDIRKYTGLITLAVVPVEPSDEQQNNKNKQRAKARRQA